SPRRETISSGEGFRGAHEAVVSDDPSGQHNPMASQGPLDGRVSVVGGRATLNREVLERVIPSGITYSWELLFRFLVRASRDLWAFLLGEGRFPRHSHLSPEDPPFAAGSPGRPVPPEPREVAPEGKGSSDPRRPCPHNPAPPCCRRVPP